MDKQFTKLVVYNFYVTSMLYNFIVHINVINPYLSSNLHVYQIKTFLQSLSN